MRIAAQTAQQRMIVNIRTGDSRCDYSALRARRNFRLLQARAALASTSELTTIPPATLAKLLVYEARDMTRRSFPCSWSSSAKPCSGRTA
jgi:hypothetical protein